MIWSSRLRLFQNSWRRETRSRYQFDSEVRELAHTELGKVVLDNILALLEEKEVGFNLDRQAKMEGRMMSMILSPSKSQEIVATRRLIRV